MKKYFSIFLITVLASSCGGIELRYFTRINSDGSVFKEVTAVGDSSKVYSNPFSFDIDDGWKVKYDKQIKNNGADTVFFAIASQTFSSIDESRQAISDVDDTGQAEYVSIHYHKKFRWFFTFHEYSEVFQQRFPYRHLCIEDFLSAEELAYFVYEDTTVVQSFTKDERALFEEKLELRFFDFIMSSIHIEYVNLLNTYAHNNGKAVINPAIGNALLQVFQSSIKDGPELEGICQITDSLLNSNWVSESYKEGYFSSFENEIDNRVVLFSSRKYIEEVEVPGLIYKSNAQDIQGQKVKWQFEGDVFQYADYPMFVYYRTTNLWAFIITIFVLGLLLWLAFVKYRRT